MNFGPQEEDKLPFRLDAELGPDCEDPLCKVSQAGFLCMLCPRVADSNALKDFRAQPLDKVSRQKVLNNQGLTWADDELLYQLQIIAARTPPDQHVIVWDPLLATSLCKFGGEAWISDLNVSPSQVATIITAVEIDHHWIPVVWRKEAASLLCFVANATSRQVQLLQKFHHALCTAWWVPLSSVHVRTISTQLQPNTGCGLVALEFIEHLLLGKELECGQDALLAKHAIYRQSFIESLPDMVSRPWIWGNGSHMDPKHMLMSLLKQHGIVESELASRYEMLCQKLGRDKVDATVSSPNPWRELKWLANQSVPPVQIVRPSELQQAIEFRAKMDIPLGRRKKGGKAKGKGKGLPHDEPRCIDPSQLRLEEGVFTANHVGLKQISLGAIGPASNGIVLATFQDALPYLQSGKPISSSGLGLIVVNMPTDVPALPVKPLSVTFPVICAVNSEPLLVEGALFQLGIHEVTKAVRETVVSLKSIDTCVAKCVIFKDKVIGSWDDVVAHPMKYLLQCVSILVPCSKGCCDEKCGFWHPPTDMQLRDPILEVWNRQWLTMSYAFSSPGDAEMFSATVRLPKHLEEALQGFSGHNGVYIEPKALDGRSVSKEYHIVWVPKSSHAQAVIYKQTVTGILGLARVGAKLGLRCRQCDSERVHKAVKPDIQFLPSGAKQTYMVGPVPWGTLKQSLNEALQTLGWEAKVLQAMPAGKDFKGVLWRVHALSPPPTSILHLADGEAVITRVDVPSQPGQSFCNAVLGSNASVKYVKKGNEQGDRGVDQVFANDPWAAYKAPVVPPMHVPDALASLEQKVLSSAIAKLPRESMEVDGEGCLDRVGVLEAKVQELHEQQSRMQTVIQENGNNQQAQMVQMQSQFQAQHLRLEKVVGEQSTKLSNLTCQFSQQLEKQQSHIDGMFQCQMQKIEDLLSKKARHE